MSNELKRERPASAVNYLRLLQHAPTARCMYPCAMLRRSPHGSSRNGFQNDDGFRQTEQTCGMMQSGSSRFAYPRSASDSGDSRRCPLAAAMLPIEFIPDLPHSKVPGLHQVVQQLVLQRSAEPEHRVLLLAKQLGNRDAFTDQPRDAVDLLRLELEERRCIQRLLRLQPVVDQSQAENMLFLVGWLSFESAVFF